MYSDRQMFYLTFYKKKTFDISYCITQIRKFTTFIEKQKPSFDPFWDELTRELSNKTIDKNVYKFQYNEVLQTVVDNTINRFKDFENLKFFELFLVRKFKEYEKFFPDVLTLFKVLMELNLINFI